MLYLGNALGLYFSTTFSCCRVYCKEGLSVILFIVVGNPAGLLVMGPLAGGMPGLVDSTPKSCKSMSCKLECQRSTHSCRMDGFGGGDDVGV